MEHGPRRLAVTCRQPETAAPLHPDALSRRQLTAFAGLCAGLVILMGLAVLGCDDISRQFVGVSGESLQVGDQFVIVTSGYNMGDVTWVVVRNWSISSTPADRRADHRLVLGSYGRYQVRGESGETFLPQAGYAYVFDGPRLVVFPLRMREDDLIGFRAEKLSSYKQVVQFFRRFERRAEKGRITKR